MLAKSLQNTRRALPKVTAVRGFAAKAETGDITGFGEMAQPKIQLFGIHARYANALYSVAAKGKLLEAVEKELLNIESTIHKVMEQGKFSKPVAGLFEVLAENGRLPDALGVIGTYKQLMSAYRGEVHAKVISADALTKAQLDQVKKALQNRIQKSETLLLEAVVDPEILGGLKVQIGNYFIDLSLATKIDKINSLLQNSQ